MFLPKITSKGMNERERNSSLRREDGRDMDCYFSESKRQCKIPVGSSNPQKLMESSHPFPLSSLELLSKYGRGLKLFNTEEALDEQSSDATCDATRGQQLSTEEIFKFARERFTSDIFHSPEYLSTAFHPLHCAFSSLSRDDAKYVELAHLLLASAEKVGSQQFDRARELLSLCSHWSSNSGNPVQRVLHYFAEALQARINRELEETGSHGSEGAEEQVLDGEEETMRLRPAATAFHQELPFVQITQFAGIQAILESVASAKKVHLVDLEIKGGVQWTILMQALAARRECPLELLKITAVGTTSKQRIKETGKRLACFAETMNLPFSFKIVMVSEINNLKEDLFESEASEVVAVHSKFFLKTLIARPDHLASLMQVIRNLNPHIVVVTEAEANTNSPAFLDRFIEALFYFGAFFDCLDAFMDRSNPNRMTVEATYLWREIRSVIATKGKERMIRHLKIDTWRTFFARFGMMETELSMSSLYQANLVVKKFACGNSCTLDMNGKCLIVSWKGTPVFSLSAWKFHQERDK